MSARAHSLQAGVSPLRARLAALPALAAALLVALVALTAFAWPAPACAADDEGADGDGAAVEGIGALSDRYESLDELANSLNSEDSVVVETRIGVLSSVNRALEGTTVRFSGEAVGAAVRADEGHVWVNLADSSDTPLAVYMTDELAGQISSYGSYSTTGSTVEVTGVYHVSCPVHQGELEVHATQLEVTDVGGDISHGVRAERLLAGVGLCAVALALIVLFVILRRRSDRKDDAQQGARANGKAERP